MFFTLSKVFSAVTKGHCPNASEILKRHLNFLTPAHWEQGHSKQGSQESYHKDLNTPWGKHSP